MVQSLAQRRAKNEQDLFAALKLVLLRREKELSIADAAGMELDQFVARFGKPQSSRVLPMDFHTIGSESYMATVPELEEAQPTDIP